MIVSIFFASFQVAPHIYLHRWAKRACAQHLAFILVFLAACSASAGPAYPLKLSPGQHYVVDQNNKPFLIQGVSPWYLTEVLSPSDVNYYLSIRAAQGYNSVILDIAEEPTPDGISQTANFFGQVPFTGTTNGYTDLLTWNVNYFTNVDAVIREAGSYGMCVFAYPMYDDYAGAGWYQQMIGNSTNSLFLYGQFIGNRYKNFTNIVWIGAGDYNEPNAPTNCLWNWIAAGIQSTDTNHLITAQPQRPTPATYYPFVTLNCSYATTMSYEQSLANYQSTPVLASFSREPYYELTGGEYLLPAPWSHIVTENNSRNFAWWSVLYGDAGQFYGNAEEWQFTNDWQSTLVDEAATSITNVAFLLDQYQWWRLVPDTNHMVITGGYGTYGTTNYVTDGATPDGDLAIAYLPLSSQVTANLARMSGPVRARWFDPTSGSLAIIPGSPFANKGSQTFTPPPTNSFGDQDWVLVLDMNPLSANLLSAATLGNGNLQLTVSGGPNQVYSVQFTTNSSSPWQTIGTGTTDISGTFLLDVHTTSSAGFYRTTSE